MNEKWLGGLKTFLSSPALHFVVSTLSFDEQKNLLERISKSIADIDDEKTRKNYTIAIVEDIFTKKPFTRLITILLLEDSLPKFAYDLIRIAKEAMKSLTSEDLWLCYKFDSGLMADCERRFNDIQGVKLENDIARIMLRYANEGRPGGLNLI